MKFTRTDSRSSETVFFLINFAICAQITSSAFD